MLNPNWPVLRVKAVKNTLTGEAIQGGPNLWGLTECYFL